MPDACGNAKTYGDVVNRWMGVECLESEACPEMEKSIPKARAQHRL